MVSVRAKIGSREVLASGSVVSRKNDEVTLTFGPLTYILRFEATPEKKSDAVAEVAGENSLRLTLKDFDTPFGHSYWAIVGDYNNRPLHIDLFVHTIGGEGREQRLINYCFSVEGATNG
jgi:hypothetical protein